MMHFADVIDFIPVAMHLPSDKISKTVHPARIIIIERFLFFFFY